MCFRRLFCKRANKKNEKKLTSLDAVASEGLSLNELLARAGSTASHMTLTKRSVADILAEEFGAKVETTSYGNREETGLPPVNVHYVLSDGEKNCFSYVYETDGAVALLLRLTESYAKSIRDGGHKIHRSAFPDREGAWYGIIVDDTYTEADVREILFDACEMAK